MKTLPYILLQGMLLLCTLSAPAQTETQSVFQMLTREELGSFSLETDLQAMKDSRKTDQGFAGTLRAGDDQSFQVQLKSKGRYRRRFGEIAPLKVKFPKKSLRAAGLDTLNEFKIMFPFTCDKAGEALLVREYVAYRIFERLSPYHIKARLALVQLKDCNTGAIRPLTCLLVEDKEETEARLKGAMVEEFNKKEAEMEAGQFALVALFQYMIGNTDWDLTAARNLRMLRKPGSDKLIAIPYDFDFAGLVAAPYAVPNSTLGIKTVQERHFMASTVMEYDVQEAIRSVLRVKPDLLTLCRFRFLPVQASEDMTKYLNDFFNEMEKNGAMPKGYKLTR